VLQADQILNHASRLLTAAPGTEIDYRRAVSAAYYAVFHLISAAAVDQACPSTPTGLWGRGQRALDHGAMKRSMASFLTVESVKRLSTDIQVSSTFSQDLAEVAQGFADLQDARYLADYDVVDSQGIVGFSWASNCVDQARHVFEAWNRAQATDEAKLFLASLIFAEKWRKK
jgi:hypothetical protein